MAGLTKNDIPNDLVPTVLSAQTLADRSIRMLLSSTLASGSLQPMSLLSLSDLQDTYQTVCAFASAVDDLDPYTRGHSLRVTHYALRLAQALHLDRQQLTQVEFGALVHDAGKIWVPRTVLRKTCNLNTVEWTIMRLHPVLGTQMIEQVEFLRTVAPIVRHHHERWDGSGYPNGLAGEAIPLLARIVATADVFDALTSERSYRAAFSLPDALAEMRRMAGRYLDPHLVTLFQEAIHSTSQSAA